VRVASADVQPFASPVVAAVVEKMPQEVRGMAQEAVKMAAEV